MRKIKNKVFNFENLLKNTYESHYWAGFLMANAHVTDKCLDLSIDKIDYDHLNKFGNFVEYYSVPKIKGNTNTFRINFSKDMHFLKEKFCFKHRKTYNPPTELAIKDDNLFLSFFCGFIDGDGNIHNKINRNQEKRESCSIFITCHGSWRETLEKWCKRVSIILNRSDYIQECKINKRGECYIYLQDMEYLVELKKKLISFGLDKIYLERKWGKINLDYSNKQFRLANERINLAMGLYNKNIEKNEIAKKLGITEGQVRRIFLDLGIKTKRSSFKSIKWTPEEDEILKKHFPVCVGMEINKYLPNRSVDAASKRYSQFRRNEKCKPAE